MTDTVQQRVALSGDENTVKIFEQMTSAAQKTFETITKGADAANKALNKFSQQASSLSSAAGNVTAHAASINNSFNAIQSGASKTATALNAAKSQAISTSSIFYNLGSALKSFDLSGINKGLSIVSNTFARARQGAVNLGQSFSFLGPQARRAATAIAAVFAAKDIVNRVDSYTNLLSRLNLVTNSEQQRAVLEKKLYAISKETQSSLAETINLYVKLSTSVERANTSIAKIIDASGSKVDTRYAEEYLNVVSQINKALRISGATTTEAKQAILQLGQSFAKGKLDGDEFRTVMESFPALSQYITRGLNITKKKLYELAKAGALTPQTIINALRSQTKQINSDFAAISPTISTTLQNVSDAFTRLIGTLDKALGSSSGVKNFFTSIINSIDEFTERLAKGEFSAQIQTIVSVFNTIKTIVITLSTALQGLATTFSSVAAALTKLTGIDISGFYILLAVIAAIATALAPIPVAIAAAVLVIGYLVKEVEKMGGLQQVVTNVWNFIVNWIKQKATEAWNWIVSTWNASTIGSIANSIVQFFIDAFNTITSTASQAWDAIVASATAAWEKIKEVVNSVIDTVKSFFGVSGSVSVDGGTSDGPGLARGGGPLRGPGTSRSDSILARLSRGEYVIRAAAVKRYGADLFQALNSMSLSPDAFLGALAPNFSLSQIPIPAYADGGQVSGRPLILNLGGQQIGGMTASNEAVKQLEKYSIKRSLTSAGKKPTWHR